MADVTFPEGDESVVVKYKDNGDGSYTPYVEAAIIGDVVVDNVDISSIAAGDNNIGNVDIVTLPSVLVTADIDITQKITVASAATPVQGPSKTNINGWYLKAKETNTGTCWYMYHGQTAANKGFSLGVGETMYVPISNLSDLDFDASVSGSIIIASKA